MIARISFIGGLALVLACVVSVQALDLNERALQDNSKYGTDCNCGTTKLCRGDAPDCGGALCGTPGENCNTITKNYETDSCVTVTNGMQGNCDGGAPYVCWEQIRCTCTDIQWPYNNRCKTEAEIMSDGEAVKRTCQP